MELYCVRHVSLQTIGRTLEQSNHFLMQTWPSLSRYSVIYILRTLNIMHETLYLSIVLQLIYCLIVDWSWTQIQLTCFSIPAPEVRILWSKNFYLHFTSVLASNKIGEVQGISHGNTVVTSVHNICLSEVWICFRRSKMQSSLMAVSWVNVLSSIVLLESHHALALDVNSR